MIVTLQTLIFFRESLLTVIERFLRPYYQKFTLKYKGDDNSDDEESDDQVFAEYDDEKGVVFYPPVYAQRYAAVSDCLMDERWCGNLQKVVDFGYHDMSFIKYLKDVPGVKHILGVDLEAIPLRCSSDLLSSDKYAPRRESPLQVTLFQGNAADPDYRLIGCDAVVAIEMIEHMLPHDLERLVHTVFGFIKPLVAVITTPNGDFNVLFKALETNGLRRLDHFFEWSREQFHDWCSNIVARYPQYTVTCKGIGPGPTGTLHLGCCSQLALFVAKEYQKQPDLDLNSLALVAKAPSPNDLKDVSGSCNSSDTMMDSVESYPELLFDEQSCMTIFIASPTFSLESMEYKDKILQCNLDMELGKNFLMFDDDLYFKVLVPTRKKCFRVYEIEDVASRLNCSTFQVKKFSKMTQNLLAKNKMDSFAHTREVVDEIRHLTRMLNFNKENNKLDFQSTWYNINWGVNAPYWNQYYKIVREYKYPFEVRTDECRILDLITEEINKLIDSDYAEEIAVEIPVNHLMLVVEHITTDVEKVKELLEWNGYKIVDDVVIHSRLIVDNISQNTQDEDWQDGTISNWDTMDVCSTELSDGSTIIPDYYGYCLRRALDQKVRKLRTLLTIGDITTELDRVVCRLMKLALHTSKEGKTPSASWMQCKLFDLLTLTENAIERRRQRQLLDTAYSLQAIECRKKNNSVITLDKTMIDPTADQVILKYEHYLSPGDNLDTNDELQRYDDSEFDEYISVTSNEFKDYEDNDVQEQPMKIKEINEIHNIELEETSELDNIQLVPYSRREDESHLISSNESTCSISNREEFKQDPPEDNSQIANIKCKINCSDSRTETVTFPKNQRTSRPKNKQNIHKPGRTKILKKISSRKSSYFNLVKYNRIEYVEYKFKEPKNPEEHQKLRSTSPRPIPGSLTKLCNSQSNIFKSSEELFPIISDNSKTALYQQTNNISATEECAFIGIVTEDGEEAVAMRRNIGTDSERNFDILENEDVLESVINVTKDYSFYSKLYVETGTVNSQMIFLADLYEPSTSNGIRHLSADVQCGPDEAISNAILSPITSVTKTHKLITTGIKIEGSNTSIQGNKNIFDFGTCTEISDDIVSICRKSVEVNIKTLNAGCINDTTESMAITQETKNELFSASPELSDFYSGTENELLKCVPSTLRIEDVSSKLCRTSYAKSSSQLSTSCKNCSDFQIQSVRNEKNVVGHLSQASYNKPMLVRGGIHVHSFKEKQVSEDVVYQGEWQQKQNLSKGHVRSHIISMKHVTHPKEKEINFKGNVGFREMKRFSKPKTTPLANRKPNIKKYEPLNKPTRNKQLCAINPAKASLKNTVKVASKLTVSSHISKNVKTIYTTKKHNCVYKKDSPIKKEELLKNMNIKNYIPLYLRKKQSVAKKGNKSENKLNIKPENIHKGKSILVKNIEENMKDLINIPEKELISNIKYMIFRNELETKNASSNIQLPLTGTTAIIKNDDRNRSHSPQSQHSSTCSSPNSIATVRAVTTRNRVICNKRNSTSSDRSSSGILESENKCTKNKKFSRRVKSNKKAPILSLALCDNKENVPESSKNIIPSKKDVEKTFLGRTKSVFMAKMTAESSGLPQTATNISKTKIQPLDQSLKLTNIDCTEEQTFELPSSSIVQKSSLDKRLVLHCLKNNYSKDNFSLKNPDSNDNIHETTSLNNSLESDTYGISNDANNDLLNNQRSIHNTKSSIISALRELIENKMNNPENSSHDNNNSDSETVILSRENIYPNSCNNSMRPASINTEITNIDSCESESDIDYLSFRNYDTAIENNVVPNSVDAKSPDTESDLFSLKSFASMSTSKFSEYYLADNELEGTLPQVDTQNMSSVQDLFERKEQNALPNVGGVLAIQAFSGFSVNESITGDQPNFINFIDSETGSFSLESARQIASEEIFVSGRSSDTYESCYFDDDSYVPNWLFNAISQQQSAEESETEEDNLSLPIAEPALDVNGNAIDPGVGVGAGAGDGRGMHSDHSQDSSGRGTSLSSSSETSSGQQSEAMSSTFTAQVNRSSEPVNLSAMAGLAGRSDESQVPIVEEINENSSNNQKRNGRNPISSVQIVSDIDADVSSLDTDAADSDN